MSETANPLDVLRVERVIALGRMVVAVAALGSALVAPIGPPAYAAAARWILIGFAGYSTVALIVLRARERATRTFALTTCTIDLLAAAIIVPALPANWFFGFFFFVVASAASRWGSREALLTTAAAVCLVLIDAGPGRGLSGLHPGAPYDLSSAAVRAVYLTLAGLLVTYVAGKNRRLRHEAESAQQLPAQLRASSSVVRGLAAAGRQAVKLLKASRLLLLIEEVGTGRLFRWESSEGWSVLPASAGGAAEMDHQLLLIGPAHRAFVIIAKPWWSISRASHRLVTLGSDTVQATDTAYQAPEGLVAGNPFRRLAVAPVAFGGDWAGRLFVFDSKLDLGPLSLAQFLQALVQRVGPAVHDLLILDETRQRAGAVERVRVGRELREGVVQSLVGLEMQIHALRGQDGLGTPYADELAEMQGIVRSEVRNLCDQFPEAVRGEHPEAERRKILIRKGGSQPVL